MRSRTPSLGTLRPDYVVVGAGAAGCVIAGRLSQILPDARIALIEAGGERLGLTTKIPGTAFIASTFPRRNWNFQTEPVPALNGRRLSWFQGRILGGSSSINGMLYLRGHSLEYNQWAQLGCHGWSFDQVLPYFKKAETNTRGASEWHGDTGPVTVKPSRLDLPICDAFLAAAGEAGFPVVDDLNADVAEGFARIDTNVANGRRVSTALAYAQPARQRGNLDLLSRAVAVRIIIEGNRARGVEVLRRGGRETIWAEREIILCQPIISEASALRSRSMRRRSVAICRTIPHMRSVTLVRSRSPPTNISTRGRRSVSGCAMRLPVAGPWRRVTLPPAGTCAATRHSRSLTRSL